MTRLFPGTLPESEQIAVTMQVIEMLDSLNVRYIIDGSLASASYDVA